MIGFEAKLERELTGTLKRLSEKGFFRSIGHAAAAIRATARRLIVRSKEPAAPGEPIRTRRGQAKRSDAILYFADADRDEALIGFTASVMDTAMSAHEHGGRYMGTDFPERPTMRPALDVNLMRFADEFEHSIGE